MKFSTSMPFDPRLHQLLQPIQVLCEVQIPSGAFLDQSGVLAASSCASSSAVMNLRGPGATSGGASSKLRARLIFEEVPTDEEIGAAAAGNERRRQSMSGYGGATPLADDARRYYMQHLDAQQLVLQPEPKVGPPDRLSNGGWVASRTEGASTPTSAASSSSLRLPSPSALLADASSYRERLHSEQLARERERERERAAARESRRRYNDNNNSNNNYGSYDGRRASLAGDVSSLSRSSSMSSPSDRNDSPPSGDSSYGSSNDRNGSPPSGDSSSGSSPSFSSPNLPRSSLQHQQTDEDQDDSDEYPQPNGEAIERAKLAAYFLRREREASAYRNNSNNNEAYGSADLGQEAPRSSGGSSSGSSSGSEDDDSTNDMLSVETMVEPVPSPLIPRRRKRRYDKAAFDFATSPFASTDLHPNRVLQPVSNVRQQPGHRTSRVQSTTQPTVVSSATRPRLATTTTTAAATSTSTTSKRPSRESNEATTQAIAEHGIEELRRCYFPTDRRNKTTPDQLSRLEEAFAREPLPSMHARDSLAAELGFPARRVQIWFQNKRAKLKRKDSAAQE
jgi:hypothetical protein